MAVVDIFGCTVAFHVVIWIIKEVFAVVNMVLKNF